MNIFFSKEQAIRPEGVILFSIISFSNEEILFKAKQKIENFTSKSNFETAPLPPWKTNSNEQGNLLPSSNSKIFSFQQKIHRDEIPLIKLKCIDIVNSLSKEDPSLKILPGYLSDYNVVLSSIKEDFHKIYLFKGVFAEVIYKYESRKFTPFSFTPEYFLNKDVLYFFTNIREYYLNTKNTKKESL